MPFARCIGTRGDDQRNIFKCSRFLADEPGGRCLTFASSFETDRFGALFAVHSPKRFLFPGIREFKSSTGATMLKHAAILGRQFGWAAPRATHVAGGSFFALHSPFRLIAPLALLRIVGESLFVQTSIAVLARSLCRARRPVDLVCIPTGRFLSSQNCTDSL